MNPITVLLAEDHLIVRDGLLALLKLEAGIRVVGEAENGRQAVALAASLSPDVVVMDIAMPLLNGLEATRQILHASPSTRVLILSAHGDDAYVEQAMALGAAGCVDRMAGEILATGLTTNINLHEARFYAYVGNPSLPTNPAREKEAEAAGDIERHELLLPVTKEFVPRARVTEPSYVQWISLSAPLVDQRKRAKAEKTSADIGQALGAFTGAASFAAGMQMAQAGNTQGVALAQQNMATAEEIMTKEAARSEAAENKIAAISSTLAGYKNTFATNQYRQVTIRIYDKVIKVSGSLDQQLAEFRKVVKDSLNSKAAIDTAPKS